MTAPRKKIVCLGLEGTAHTSGVGIVDSDCLILANEKHTFTTEEGGLIPRELADHHLEKFPGLIENALKKSKKEWKAIDCIAFSQEPGIGAPLTVTATAARTLALLHNKPLVGVNHCVAHIEIGKKMCSCKDPLVLYVSGGNSQIIGYESGRYRVYGETLDTGVVNLLDTFGRSLGIGFPAGPVIDKMYFEGKEYIDLPYSVKGMDLAFSGLLTAAKLKIEKVKKEDLAYSLMHTAFAMLLEVTERALAHTGKKELLITGGVAASKALQKMASEMCKEREVKLYICPQEVAQDNGVMVSWLGILMYKSGVTTTIEESKPNQRFRTDQQEVTWL